jgi:hypothetical protein
VPSVHGAVVDVLPQRPHGGAAPNFGASHRHLPMPEARIRPLYRSIAGAVVTQFNNLRTRLRPAADGQSNANPRVMPESRSVSTFTSASL